MKNINEEDFMLIPSAIEMERQFSENEYHGCNTGAPLIVIQGDIPLVLSCPHAVSHPRNGQIKRADTFTGTLTIQLASLTGANALIYSHTSEEDPNYDTDGPYKRQLIRLVLDTKARFVLDLHGIRQSRPIDIAIGTSHGTTLGGQRTDILSVWTQIFREAGLKNILVDDPYLFNAERETTIAFFIWRELGVPALQLEIHKKYRNARQAPYDYLKMLYLLRDGLDAVQRLL